MIRTGLRLTLVVAGIITIITLACAHNPPSGNAPSQGNHDRSLLIREEFGTATDPFLYDVVQRLRPEWLRVHGQTSISNAVSAGAIQPDPVHVYMGMVRLGGPEVLSRMATNQADTVKYFTAAQAQARFGSGNTNGVIQVIAAPPPP